MNKKILSILILLIITPCLMAQKKELSQARSDIKNNRNLAQTEKLLSELSADSIYKLNPDVYLLWYQSVLKQYEVGNEKLYLKQKYDTAAMYSMTKKMFDILMKLDTIDATPNNKGKIKIRFRKKHSEKLNILRPNLFFGGAFYIHKGDYQNAFNLYDIYLKTFSHPMFEDYKYCKTDTNMYHTAYLTTYCGYMLNKPNVTLKYSDIALLDSVHNRYVIQYMAEAYKLEGNTDKYIKTLSEGFYKYPNHSYFFPRLNDYYISKGMPQKALEISNKALEADSLSILFLYAKSTLLLNLGRYDESINVSEKIISLNDTLPEPYYNAGMAWMNKVYQLENEKNTVGYKNKLLNIYRKAMPYIERYRVLSPKDKDNWAPILYKIYFNLNMGKKFDEIDKIITK